MLYEVRALSADNRMSTLVLEAQDEGAARAAAGERSLRALAVRPAPRGAARRSRAAFPVVLFSQELLALLEAGLTIVESLESLSERSTPGVSRDVAAALAHALQQGQRFSQALAAFPDHFPPLYVGIVQAAETTSDLPGSLARYVEFETRIATVRAKAVSAAIYPAILLVVGGGVTLFLLGYVVPRFASVYAEAGREMSFLTSVLLAWGQFVANHTGFIVFALASAVIGAIIGWRALREKFSISDVLAKLPWVGQRARTYELSRLYMTVGLLLSGGITLVRALQMVEATVGAGTRAQLQLAAQRIASGETFSAAMQANHLAEPVALRLFRVGERAGNLGEMLIKAATFYDTEVTRLIERFSRAAEPIMMAAIGIVVGTIVVLLYIPIFELAGSLQ
jgi:general secretion pathway protein F